MLYLPPINICEIVSYIFLYFGRERSHTYTALRALDSPSGGGPAGSIGGFVSHGCI